MKKLTVTVNSCKECPFRFNPSLNPFSKHIMCAYGIPYKYKTYCTPITDVNIIPNWCPLEDIKDKDKCTDFGVIYPEGF